MSEKPLGIRVLADLERLSVRSPVNFARFSEVFSYHTCLQLVLEVMYYDVEVNKEMRLHIEKVVKAEGEKTKLETENFRLAMELSAKWQIDDAFNGISAVIRE